MAIRFYNTLSHKVEKFIPIEQDRVSMYHCGPTVYGTQHIGNLSMFVFTDVLRRTLERGGFGVRQVTNFTDFGHLSSDADEGEDKMAKGLREEGLAPTLENMKKLGEKYAGIFLEDLEKLNVRTEGTLFPYASEYVEDQIELIKRLEEKGFAYKTSDGVYFDTSKFEDYGKLGGLSSDGVESRVGENSEKRNQRDFALWKTNDKIGWESPWGQGFPGWHIECSAMIMKLLGEQIDIHTGGVEHISVHHNNEIAQSEAATGKKPFSRFWLHRAHLRLEGSKIAKSEGNVIYLSDIVERGVSPLAYRYFLLLSHYRTPANFSWEALEAAEAAYKRLKMYISTLPEGGQVDNGYKTRFDEKVEDDLNTPEALAVVWNLVKDTEVSDSDKRATLLAFDTVLGLDLEHNEYLVDIPSEVIDLGKKRHKAKEDKDYGEADRLRTDIESLGYEIRDVGETFIILKK